MTNNDNVLPETPARFDWMSQAPKVFQAMLRLDTAAKQGLPDSLVNLIKIRASQLNQCAFCLDMHSKDALAAGETPERLLQLNAWSESKHFYTAIEIAAIELTDAVTSLINGFVPDELYNCVTKVLGEEKMVKVISVIVAINAFNRFGVSSRMVPGHCTPGGNH